MSKDLPSNHFIICQVKLGEGTLQPPRLQHPPGRRHVTTPAPPPSPIFQAAPVAPSLDGVTRLVLGIVTEVQVSELQVNVVPSVGRARRSVGRASRVSRVPCGRRRPTGGWDTPFSMFVVEKGLSLRQLLRCSLRGYLWGSSLEQEDLQQGRDTEWSRSPCGGKHTIFLSIRPRRSATWCETFHVTWEVAAKLPSGGLVLLHGGPSAGPSALKD